MWSPVLLNVPHLPSHASAIISLFVGTLKYSVCKCNYTGTYTQSCLWSNLCRNFTVFYLLKHLWQWKFFGFLFFLFFFFLCQTLSIGYVVIISSTWAVDDECPVQTCWPVEGGGWEITCNRTDTAFVLWMKSWQLWLNHAATIQCWHKTPVVCEKAPPLMHFK